MAAVAISLVLVGLAIYSVSMDRRSSTATTEAERAILIARAYGDISMTLKTLEQDATTFMFHPTPAGRAAFDAGVEVVLGRLGAVEQIGTPADLRVVNRIRNEYLPQLDGVQAFFDALLSGQPYFGEVADEQIVADLYAALEQPAREREEASLRAMQQLRSHQQQRVITTAGVFAGGLGLVGLLLWVQRHSSEEMARAEAALTKLRRESATDSLTGLGNHRAFQELLREIAPSGGALVMVDLDRFKEANDVRGHAEGDQILRSVADLLARIFPSRAFRIGGDEFAAITSSYADGTRCAERLVLSLRERVPGITASAGVAPWEAVAEGQAADGNEGVLDEFDADLVFAQADAALRWAKREGRNHWVGYPDIADRVGGVASAKKSQAVRRLIQQETGISTMFQPIWGLDGELRACEALSRFAPELGLDGPEEAFDIANQDGRSFELDRLCFDSAVRSAKTLPSSVTLFINISPSALIDQRFSAMRLVSSARRQDRSPSTIVLEVTERAEVPLDVLQERIAELRAAGFGIALDDVGAGNAGLETLRRVPVDWIKIDRSIVHAAPTDPVARGMMRALVAFAGEAGDRRHRGHRGPGRTRDGARRDAARLRTPGRGAGAGLLPRASGVGDALCLARRVRGCRGGLVLRPCACGRSHDLRKLYGSRVDGDSDESPLAEGVADEVAHQVEIAGARQASAVTPEGHSLELPTAPGLVATLGKRSTHAVQRCAI